MVSKRKKSSTNNKHSQPHRSPPLTSSLSSDSLASDDTEALHDPDLLPTMNGSTDGRSCTDLLDMVINPSTPIRLMNIPSDEPLQLPSLFYNGITLELCDLFRLIRGLRHKERSKSLKQEDISNFYEWFEIFFGILTCLFDMEEDLLYSPLESQIEHHALLQHRRTLKKQRSKDFCWDIIHLKSTSSKAFLIEHLEEDAQLLAARIISYLVQSAMHLPPIMQSILSFDEQCLLQRNVMTNLRASEPGKMLICAVARSFMDPAQKNSFLDECLRHNGGVSGNCASGSVPLRTPKAAVTKQIRKFRKAHVDIVNKLAIDQVIIESQ